MTTEEQVATMERLVKEKQEFIDKYNELNRLVEYLKGRHIISVDFAGNSNGSDFRVRHSGDLLKCSILLHIKEQINDLSRQIKGTITV